MGKSKCCDAQGLKKGVWTEEEDQQLLSYVKKHGEGSWRLLPQKAGLLRCGKSCRLRWANYLRPGIRRGEFSHEEEETIIRLHASLGNRWATIARHLYRRTDNEVKNYWNTRLKKRVADSDTAIEDFSADENLSDLTNPTNNILSLETREDSDVSASPVAEKANTSLSSNSLSPDNNCSTEFDLVCPSPLEVSSSLSSRGTSGNFTTPSSTEVLNKIASKMGKFNLRIGIPFDPRSPVVDFPTTSNNVDAMFEDYASVFKETTSSEVFEGQFMDFQFPGEEFLLQNEAACNVKGFYDKFDADLEQVLITSFSIGE